MIPRPGPKAVDNNPQDSSYETVLLLLRFSFYPFQEVFLTHGSEFF